MTAEDREDLNRHFDGVPELIAQLSQQIDRRFDTVDRRLETRMSALETRMGALEFQMTGLNKSLDQSDRTITQMLSTQAAHRRRSTTWPRA